MEYTFIGGDGHIMIFRKKERDDILTNEPYATFIKKFDKLQSVKNEKIHIRIDTNDNGKKTGFTSGFYLDSCYAQWFATVYKGNIIKNLIMDCQSYTKYRPNETTGGIFVSWRRKEELPTGA